MTALFGGGNKGPSQSELIAQQEAAAKKEREKIALETAQNEATSQAKTQAAYQDQESKRRAFAGSLTAEDDNAQRRKFMKAA